VPRLELEGSPIAYACAGLAVAIAYAIGVAAATEPEVPRDERARLVYARCLAGEGPAADCPARRDAYLTLCYARFAPAACELGLRAVERDPRAALAAAVRPPPRLAGPFQASPPRAAWGAALCLFPLAWALAGRGHGRERVLRVAAGAAVGALLAAVPPLAALAAGTLLAALVPGSDVVLLGFGFFVATFVAVLAMPALAGAADAGGDAVRARLHRALALAAAGMSLWIVVVGPIPGLATVWLQSAAAHALAVTGYLSIRAGEARATAVAPG
jgi:hypothetical protein